MFYSSYIQTRDIEGALSHLNFYQFKVWVEGNLFTSLFSEYVEWSLLEIQHVIF